MNELNIQPLNPAISSAKFKQTADDFVVKEILDIEFDGTGEHLWLFIKKSHVNTAFVVKLLSDWANIKPSDIGFSGLKDRHATTYQWFSLRIPQKTLPQIAFNDFIQIKYDDKTLNDNECIEPLQSVWHGKKLHRGTHKANHFIIKLKEVMGDKNTIDTLIQQIKQCGVPNYFGEQRFGNDGNNIINAQRFFAKILANNKPYKPHKKDLNKNSIYISTAKSLIFNKLLSERITRGYYDTPLMGDVFNLAGTGSLFCDGIDDVILQRLASHDIHIAGLMFGAGRRLSRDDAYALEEEILNLPQLQIFKDGLIKVGTQASYRPLRLLPQELIWQWDKDCLTLQFALPTGGFATSVLSALGDIRAC